MKKLMMVALCALAANMAAAKIIEEVQIDGLVYSLDTEAKTATITANWTEPESIDISTVTKDNQEYVVVSVGYRALKDCKSLTSVSLPNVTTIEGYAFTGLGLLASVSLPKAVLIGESAFSGCPLTSITLPCATTISEGAFYSCHSLASVSLPKANEIGDSAFQLCSSLVEVSFPNVTKVGNHAFDDAGIASISLPNATTIGEYAFFTRSLTNVSLPNATTLGEGAFCSASVSSVSLPNATKICGEAFWGCSSLTSVALPSATEIGQYAFNDCSNLTFIGVSAEMKTYLDQNRDFCSVGKDVEIKVIPKLTEEQTRGVAWNAKITSDDIVLMLGDKTVSEGDYESACEFYGITPQPRRTVDDFKVVDKDAQVVKEGEIAVTKESIQAAKAMTVQIVNGQIELGVSVCSNADITASSANWAPVKFTKDTQIGLSADGTKLVLPIPVAAQQGFMILQSGDAKAAHSDTAGTVGFMIPGSVSEE